MEGLPLLPGYTFKSPTETKFNMPHHFDWKNGYAIPKPPLVGIGQKPLDINSVAFCTTADPVRYDPSLTYGRTKNYALPTFKPHYVLYDKKCLTFHSFFKRSVVETPDEHYRIHKVNIIYFLDDDTITVMEPATINAGYPQGRVVRRGRIPKDTSGAYYHWKDFNVGIDMALYGITYHICSCDLFTKEYMISQGIELNAMEDVPEDPYAQSRAVAGRAKVIPGSGILQPIDDPLRRFLEFDGKILRYYAVWEPDEDERRAFLIYYFLADDRVQVAANKEMAKSGEDPFPLLLKKMKVPRNWKEIPLDYPACYLEKGDADVTEYYQPKDFIIGETLNILGRRFLIYDCDEFTRRYYSHCLKIEQPAAIDVDLTEKRKETLPARPPPHIAFGMPEDTIQSCYALTLKPPKKDVIRLLVNQNKKLRYTAVLDWVHPEDEVRQFIIEYNLAEGTILIQELKVQNSGFMPGRFLKSMLVAKPGADRDNPEFYTPADLAVGNVIEVFGHRFKITNADLAVYRYMEANPEKFSEEMLAHMRGHFVKEGLLTQDIKAIADFEAKHKLMPMDDCVQPECPQPDCNALPALPMCAS